MSKVAETIKEMARLTLLSNKLNDIQIKNLTSYPFIFFDGLQQVTVDYDLSNTMDISTEEDSKTADISYAVTGTGDNMYIAYYLDIDKNIKQTHVENRYSALEQSVQGILWKDLKVKIFINKELAYETKNEQK